MNKSLLLGFADRGLAAVLDLIKKPVENPANPRKYADAGSSLSVAYSVLSKTEV